MENSKVSKHEEEFENELDELISGISKIKNGDILVNLVGASIGRSCTFSGNKEANVNQAVAIIRLKDQKYKTFLQSFLMSVQGKRILLGECSGGPGDL